MNIIPKSNKETVIYAASELKKYLKMMLPDNNARMGDMSDGIIIGCFKELNIECNIDYNLDDDDVIYIETTSNKGVISGNNPRSVLLAVYEYLRRQGCRWLFPGVDGEYIPVIDDIKDVSFVYKYPQKVRGECIEGAVSVENVLAAIDFAPKIGLNSYMLECYSPFGYLDHWYSHRRNETKENEHLSLQTAIQWKRLFEAEISKRGLLYHDMGHGWTTLAFDMNPDTNEICAENIEFLAEINGKRGLHNGSAIDTNFCMSNKKGVKKLLDYIVNYAENHDNVDYLHIWLADGRNNHCECEECSRYLPSELYVQFLNELDKELDERKINTKIVFICYSDLIWAPVKEKIENTERFLLLFAPISRDYLSNYGVDPDMSAIKEYKRNCSDRPTTLEGCLAYLKKWRDNFSGDVFCYEYHFHSINFKDYGGIWTARCAFDDARGLKKNKLCGIIEDHTQRDAYPTGFAIYAWAKAMSDENITFDEIAKDYFSHAFGEDWEKAYEFLSKVGDIFSKEYMLGCFTKGENVINSEIQNNMPVVKTMAKEFKEVCNRNLKKVMRCQAVSWQLLRFHCDLCLYIADMFHGISSGSEDETVDAIKKFNSFLSNNEDFYQKYLDMALMKILHELALDKNSEDYMIRANQ